MMVRYLAGGSSRQHDLDLRILQWRDDGSISAPTRELLTPLSLLTGAVQSLLMDGELGVVDGERPDRDSGDDSGSAAGVIAAEVAPYFDACVARLKETFSLDPSTQQEIGPFLLEMNEDAAESRRNRELALVLWQLARVAERRSGPTPATGS